MPFIQGHSVAAGLALGPVHVVRSHVDAAPTWSLRPDEVGSEIRRLQTAIETVQNVLARRHEDVAKAVGERDAGILAVHQMILEDPGARRDVDTAIREERINAEAAIGRLVERLRETMGRLEGDSVRGYAADVTEPWRAVIAALMRTDQEQLVAAEAQVIIAAAELTPDAVTVLPRDRILGIVTEAGGRFSHGAVLARSFGIPCVVGIPNLLARLEQDMPVFVDGDRGGIVLDPDDEVRRDVEEARALRDARLRVLEAHATLPAIAPDGARINVLANLESVRDVDLFDVAQCDGTGLLRTEFLYRERTAFPSEEEQFRMYRRVVDAMEGRPVTIRTLDIGGDKQLPYFKTPREANPALGWRGVRVTLQWQDLLRVQLRAIMRAAAHGPVKVLLPMISSTAEIDAVHAIFDDTRRTLVAQGYPVPGDLDVGVMIEVPSTLWILDEILERVDFLSVGTNDLVQYLLAVDRDNVFVSELYEPLHPAVVRALHQIAAAARRAGKSASVCGEIAGDEAIAVMLAGMGYDSLSVSPAGLARLKFALSWVPQAAAAALAEEAREAETGDRVRAILDRLRDELDDAIRAADDGGAESSGETRGATSRSEELE